MSALPILADRMQPCGPVLDTPGGQSTFDVLAEAAAEEGWTGLLTTAEPALRPVFAASPYLAGLVRRWPGKLRSVLEVRPEARLDVILSEARALNGGAEGVREPLRLLKADLHLLTALCDLGGVWDLDAVTGALSAFADAALQTAFVAVAEDQVVRGHLVGPVDPANPVPGLFGLAMGKHGAHELNYSSDIDVTFFYEPEVVRRTIAATVEAQAFVDRVAGAVARLLSERTGEGYVFRVDLRLRPDPGSTPPVVSAPAALNYYGTVGQNWERAAFIKARAVVGDGAEARGFLKALIPFVWRRSLDFAAVSDVHSIKRQIHVHKIEDRPTAAGADLKLGRGGIREIEFFVQTQQLILGGRDPSLRSSRTLDALMALAEAGHVDTGTAISLSTDYVRLRSLEHRIQMLDDEQTHTLPVEDDQRRRVAALSGQADLVAFDQSVEDLTSRVNARYGELFAEDEALSSELGSLVFTGIENDSETLKTLGRMGFSEPDPVATTIRGWHHGRILATRSAQGREVFTRFAPRLLEACAATGAPDAAFRRFARFFEGLRAGVQVQSLFLAKPRLFRLIVETLAFSPRLAEVLSRRPAALDAIMDPDFFLSIEADSGIVGEIEAQGRDAADFESAMNAIRRLHREQDFRISLQVLSGIADPARAGDAFSDLAQACVRALAYASRNEVDRIAGRIDGQVAVVALGKLGSREMSGASDLDLMTVYEAPGEAESDVRGWSADRWFGRFTQRLIAALSTPTAEGGLYEVDMRLRPSGAAGPVAVSLRAFGDYYAREADTWEFLALTRARVVWATSAAFERRVADAVEAALRQPRDRGSTLNDVAAMRALMAREHPPWSFWDMKRASGGLIDCEFVVQALQLVNAPDGGPLRAGTLAGLASLCEGGVLSADLGAALTEAWTLQQGLAQLLRSSLDRRSDPEQEPTGFQQRLSRIGGVETLAELTPRVEQARRRAREAYETLLDVSRDGISD
ncbi:MAG TPA: bifunctional [glutamine synthetase] adenylyltransferase/[glutamine synthetase]-adenylyl-L-tyrosine phosphorylase [Brevundimonas sp.]|uniref:bifunctional [glutamine synthetase] adenylyltransferase/[glutamine synthetase]-adenylyl-L-tyrosine phosphorylase n=1 Tax=Brevundimonas sp. TaxID=1871086 RepID=UPI002B952918|nr:bifunctional [glutamine synthetase] adenylyltransferase/[glutamine synthetase]-adenylyl-L-tyrosine phosphorylase [Brevundimonas sp.]HRH19463.1 bifunctional [glutamine synthetase] adenylyltransferase/[glutamine synthetase]-adenylyl-L-tyrosine phosphorylase [Brevundimonas sp.]